MTIFSTTNQQLHFSSLFTDYLSEKKPIHSFFEYLPFDEQELIRRAEEISWPGRSEAVVEQLKQFNRGFSAGEETLCSLDRLNQPDSLTVVTGQQLILLGGPLFTIYKILTAIIWARRLEKLCSRPVIPLFWLADEDHDYEEAATVGLYERQQPVIRSLEKSGDHSLRVSEIHLQDSFGPFLDDLSSLLPDTDFKQEVLDLLQEAYRKPTTFGKSFGRLILSLFGKHGLVLAGSNSPDLKTFVKTPMQQSVEKHREIFHDLKETSNQLIQSGYHAQVQVNPSNLFYIDEHLNRLRIQMEDDRWVVSEKMTHWSKEELIEEIESEPARFSPNVFLRPIVQNYLVPAAVYIAGPGEVAYYAQMKPFYSHFDLKMPVIVPRFSLTLRENSIRKQMDELPFELHEYRARTEDLESEYLNRVETPDVEALFSGWKEETGTGSESYANEVAKIDPTLEAASARVITQFHGELDKLKGKVYRSLKESEKVNIHRIHRIQAQLFPNRNLQEREVAMIWFMNKYGIELWDQMLSLLESEQPYTHKLIDL